MTGTAVGVTAVVLLNLATAFFVASEFAFVAADRTRITRLAEAGHRRARVVLRSLQRLSFELSGAQLGITLAALGLGFVAESTIGELVEPLVARAPGLSADAADGIALALALVLATGVNMVVGELVPKNVAIAAPERTALWIGPLFRLYSVLTTPLVRFSNALANATVRRMGIEPREELDAVRSLTELEQLIQTSGELGTLPPASQELLTRAIRFGDKTAADALVPRTSVTALDRDASVTELIATARDTGLSRFPVTGRDLDDVLGVVHVKSAYQVPIDRRALTPVGALMAEAVVVPETKPLDDLLVEMRAGRSQMAVVIDEYGGTAGIITIEDLVEEIVGDIRDEYDPVEPGRFTIPWIGGSSAIDGSLHPDEVRDLIGLEIPEGPYETLAGYLLVLFDRIPAVGDRVDADGWRFEVAEMDRLRISRVRITPPARHAREERR